MLSKAINLTVKTLLKLTEITKKVLIKCGFKGFLPNKSKNSEFIYGTIEVDSSGAKYLQNINPHEDNITEFPKDFKSTIIEGDKVVVSREYWSTDEPITETFVNCKNIKGGVYASKKYPLSGKIFKLLKNIYYIVSYYSITSFFLTLLACYIKTENLINNDIFINCLGYLTLIPLFLFGLYRSLAYPTKNKSLFELTDRIFNNLGVLFIIIAIILYVATNFMDNIECILLSFAQILGAHIYYFAYLKRKIKQTRIILTNTKENFDSNSIQKAKIFNLEPICSNKTEKLEPNITNINIVKSTTNIDSSNNHTEILDIEKFNNSTNTTINANQDYDFSDNSTSEIFIDDSDNSNNPTIYTDNRTSNTSTVSNTTYDNEYQIHPTKKAKNSKNRTGKDVNDDVLTALKEAFNKGEKFKTQHEIAKKAGVDDSQASRALDILEQQYYIEDRNNLASLKPRPQ